MSSPEEFTIGVEEEYQIIDPKTRELCGRAEKIISHAEQQLDKDIVQPELYRSQVEIATSVCQTLDQVRFELVKARSAVIEAAAKDGKAIAAAGTHPFSKWQQQKVTPKERYQKLQQDFQLIIRDMVIFGCHVHVGLSDRQMAIEVVNRSRIWLSVLLALFANSPFWLGEDTGYASYRTGLWSRLPLTGAPLVFSDYEEYQGLLNALIATGAIEDATKIYWDIRLSERFPTLEFRVTDICLSVDEAVALAGLVRGLVQTSYREAIDKMAYVRVRPELLKTSHWQAARYGLDADLIDVVAARSLPAKELVEQLLTYVRPALEVAGDWEKVSSVVEKILAQGNSAKKQREIYQHTGSLEDVVDFLIAQTKNF